MGLVSLLLPDLRGGGVERIRLVLAREIVRAGHQVEFVLMQAKGELLTEAAAEFPVHILHCPRARGLPIALARYLRTQRPDALLVAMWPLTTIAPLMRLVGYRGRVVVSEHNTLSIQYASWGTLHRLGLRASMALGYRMAHARIGVSVGVVNDIASLSYLSRKAFHVVHNPVPPRASPTTKALAAAEAFWPVAHGARIVTVGSMKRQKNHELLLRAFAALCDTDAALMLVGKGKEEMALRQLADKLRIADRVVFAGFHSDPTPLYQTADLFVLSSDYEGFGNVIVEALAQGTPVVSTNCPSGPAEILEGGRWGELVPVGDLKGLANAIARALATPHDRDALKQRAAKFAPEVAASQYLDLLFQGTN